MAITAAALQTAIGDGNVMGVRVLQAYGTFGTQQHWYIKGGVSYPGRCKRVATTAADNAATQATAVLAAMLVGPAGVGM